VCGCSVVIEAWSGFGRGQCVLPVLLEVLWAVLVPPGCYPTLSCVDHNLICQALPCSLGWVGFIQPVLCGLHHTACLAQDSCVCVFVFSRDARVCPASHIWHWRYRFKLVIVLADGAASRAYVPW